MRGVLVLGWVVVSLTFGCTAATLGVDILAVDVDGAIVIRPGSQSEFEVTATNRTNQRVVWGMGSSSCQLGLVVLVSGQVRDIDFRACTDDLVEQGLNPDERRTERFVWDGHVSADGALSMLPPGLYRVFGIAGDEGQSAPLRVTILEE